MRRRNVLMTAGLAVLVLACCLLLPCTQKVRDGEVGAWIMASNCVDYRPTWRLALLAVFLQFTTAAVAVVAAAFTALQIGLLTSGENGGTITAT